MFDIMFDAWRGVRVVEGARLESVCAGNRTESSNLFLSAKQSDPRGLFVYLNTEGGRFSLFELLFSGAE